MLQHVIDMKKFDADADRCLGLVTIYEDSDTGTDAVVSSIASGSWLRDSASVDLCSEVTTSLEGEGERVLSVKPASCASVSTTSCGGSAASAGRSVGDIWPGGCGEGDDWFTGTALHFTSDRTGEVGGTTSDTIAGAASLPLALGTGGVGVMLVLSADPSTVTTLSTGKSIHPTNNKHFTAIVLEQTGWASTRKTCQTDYPPYAVFLSVQLQISRQLWHRSAWNFDGTYRSQTVLLLWGLCHRGSPKSKILAIWQRISWSRSVN